MPKKPDDENLIREEETSFEDALAELERLTAQLEEGNLPLTQMLSLTRRGVALADLCEAKLNAAEQVLEQLTASTQGELVAEEMAWEEDEDDEDDSAA